MRENENPRETLKHPRARFFFFGKAGLNLGILVLGYMGLNGFLVKTQ